MNWLRTSIQRRVLFPWLVAIYPVVFLYSLNVGLVQDGEVPQVLAFVLLMTAPIYLYARRKTQDDASAGAIAAVVMLGFLTYGHIYNVVWRIPLARLLLLPAMVGLNAGLIVLIVRHKETVQALVPILNTVILLLFIMPVVTIAGYGYDMLVNDVIPPANAEEFLQPEIEVSESPSTPDIYYIIADGYPREDYLQAMGYDNSAFVAALRARGFYVADRSKSNYTRTRLSLPSSLNMMYLDEYAEIREGTASYRHVDPLIPDNEVARQLQARGYAYYHIGSAYTPYSTIAEYNVDFTLDGPVYLTGSEVATELTNHKERFWMAFLRTTVLKSLAPYLNRYKENTLLRRQSTERFLMALDETVRIAELNEPTFTYLHLLKPHPPLVFDPEGTIITTDIYAVEVNELDSEDGMQRFFDQLVYVNERLLALIDDIVARSSQPPIIILQGDHGLTLGDYEFPPGGRPPYILNAYYLPDGGSERLYPEITPVNTFRVILDIYFGTDYGLLADRVFASPSGGREPFEFIEITGETDFP